MLVVCLWWSLTSVDELRLLDARGRLGLVGRCLWSPILRILVEFLQLWAACTVRVAHDPEITTSGWRGGRTSLEAWTRAVASTAQEIIELEVITLGMALAIIGTTLAVLEAHWATTSTTHCLVELVIGKSSELLVLGVDIFELRAACTCGTAHHAQTSASRARNATETVVVATVACEAIPISRTAEAGFNILGGRACHGLDAVIGAAIWATTSRTSVEVLLDG